ncbi:MAG: nuclear transport factor 2 family protein [Lewinellaceae bacterium]|nr:nuclear transport factor 2 family protein [Saprospiraceae bacterium]MCB9337390.1 nuclear transport factor 2 family protein [Lewinellaceae bacterium]
MQLTPIVQQIYASFGQGDVPSIIEKMDDNVQWEKWADNHGQKAGVPWLKEEHGKDGVMAFFQCIGQHLNFKDFQVLSIMEGGNQVAAEVVVDADVTSSARHLKEEEMHLWTFNDAGKVTRFRHYADTKKHIEAAGL